MTNVAEMNEDEARAKIARETAAAMALIDALGDDARDDELLADMVEGETTLMEMIDAIVEGVFEDEELIEGIKLREDRLAVRKNRLNNRIGRRKAMLEQALLIFTGDEGKKSLQRPEATLTLRKNPDKLTFEEAEVPHQYFVKTTAVKLDKKALTAALKALTPADEPIPGARLDPAPPTLAIRKA